MNSWYPCKPYNLPFLELSNNVIILPNIRKAHNKGLTLISLFLKHLAWGRQHLGKPSQIWISPKRGVS